MTSSSSQSSEIIGTTSTTWTIENFSNTDEIVWSPAFSLSSSNRTSVDFQLGIFPNSAINCGDDVFVYLWNGQTEEMLNLEYDVSILKASHEKGHTKKFYWNYDKRYDHFRNATFFITKSNLTKASNGYVRNNKLTLRCDINLLASPVSPNKQKVTENTVTNIGTNDNVLLQNYQSLLESGKHSNVILQIGEKEIHAHKTILAAQSPWFYEYFETKETQEGRIKINDIDSDLFEELLRYIYSGAMPQLDKYAQELFVAAFKYRLDHLKSICEISLGSSLSMDSVASVLQLADFHQADKLKAKCVNFITANSAEVLASDGWKKLRKTQLELVSEMLENIIISVTSKK